MVGASYGFLAVAIRWFGIHFFLIRFISQHSVGNKWICAIFPISFNSNDSNRISTSCEKGALHAAHFWLNKTKTNVTNSFKQSFKCCFRFRVILHQTVGVFFLLVFFVFVGVVYSFLCNFPTLLLTQMLPKRINWVCVRAFANVYGINE